MYITVYKDVIFIEGSISKFKPMHKIEVSLKGFSAQLQSLNHVKEKMAENAKEQGANAIIEFEYGQKTPGFWSSYGDNVNWYGKGIAVILSKEEYQSIVNTLTSD